MKINQADCDRTISAVLEMLTEGGAIACNGGMGPAEVMYIAWTLVAYIVNGTIKHQSREDALNLYNGLDAKLRERFFSEYADNTKASQFEDDANLPANAADMILTAAKRGAVH